MNAEYIIIILIGFILVREGFHMWYMHKLVNKLMSRDFFSYNQVMNPPKVSKGFTVNIDDPEIDRVKELNSSLGLNI